MDRLLDPHLTLLKETSVKLSSYLSKDIFGKEILFVRFHRFLLVYVRRLAVRTCSEAGSVVSPEKFTKLPEGRDPLGSNPA